MKNTQKKGGSILEVLLAIALFSVFLTGVLGYLTYGKTITRDNGDRMQAIFLAEEGLEVILNIAEQNYDSLVDGSFFLEIQNNEWQISNNQERILDRFDRKINIEQSGTNKLIKSIVEWSEYDKQIEFKMIISK